MRITEDTANFVLLPSPVVRMLHDMTNAGAGRERVEKEHGEAQRPVAEKMFVHDLP
jgi:hypothetical protein